MQINPDIVPHDIRIYCSGGSLKVPSKCIIILSELVLAAWVWILCSTTRIKGQYNIGLVTYSVSCWQKYLSTKHSINQRNVGIVFWYTWHIFTLVPLRVIYIGNWNRCQSADFVEVTKLAICHIHHSYERVAETLKWSCQNCRAIERLANW